MSFLDKIGLSIIFIYASGLLISTLKSSFDLGPGINNGLSQIILFIAFSGVLVSEARKIFRLFSFKSLIQFLTLSLPLLAFFAANRLNYSGANDLVLLCLGLIILLFVLSQVFEFLSSPVSIYSIALSLLFLFSARSQLLMGYDIHQEHEILKLTYFSGQWLIEKYANAYNACLSITILPTVISRGLNLTTIETFKYIFPLLLAFIPVAVFFVSSRLVSQRMAMVSAFLFLVQAQFFLQLPAILRQGIAFLFFSLLINRLAGSVWGRRDKFLVVIFGIGMVLSHYSTTYLGLVILIFAWVLSRLVRRFFPSSSFRLSFRIISVIAVFTVLWNLLITGQTAGVGELVTKTATNIGQIFNEELKSDFVNRIFYRTPDSEAKLAEYVEESRQSIPDREARAAYPVRPVFLDTSFPSMFSRPAVIYLNIIIPWIFRAAILIGVALAVIFAFRRRQFSDMNTLALSAVIISVLIIVLPFLSINYNFERVFQQALVILAVFVPFLFQRLAAIKFLFLAVAVPGVIAVSYLFNTTGLGHYLVSNSPHILLTNTGGTYYSYYSHLGEYYSARWIQNSVYGDIRMDRFSFLKFIAYSEIPRIRFRIGVNPFTIRDYEFVYANFANASRGVTFSDYKGTVLSFTYPTEYLSQTKGLIYSNGVSYVYR